MEECQNKKVLNFQEELRGIFSLEERINEAKKEINLLLKIESIENKNLKTIYNSSLVTTRNKVNLFQNHQFIRQRHQKQQEQLHNKQEKVKEMREKGERELKEIRDLLKKNKENDRLAIKNNSVQYERAIKKNREIQLQKKQKIVKEIRNEKQAFKKSVADSRIQEFRQKQVEAFNLTLAKIDRQPSLAKEFQRLTKEKEQIERRVKQRKNLKLKLKTEAEKIKILKESEVVEIITRSPSMARQESYRQKKLAPLTQKGTLKSIESMGNLNLLLWEGRLEFKGIV